jgi:ubiquitin C-terminal hydrolase
VNVLSSPLQWYCFMCQLDLSDSNVPPKGLGKIKQCVTLIEKEIGKSGGKKTAATIQPSSRNEEKLPTLPATTASSASSAIVVKGLRNTGNTCFFNSVLQCLSASVPLNSMLIDHAGKTYDGTAIDNGQPIQTALLHFLQSMSTGSGVAAATAAKNKNDNSKVVVPTALLSAVQAINPMFRGNRQHDSHELLRTIINGIISGKGGSSPQEAPGSGCCTGEEMGTRTSFGMDRDIRAACRITADSASERI